MVIFFLKFGMVKVFKTLYNVTDAKKLTTSDKNIWVNQHASIFNLDFN